MTRTQIQLPDDLYRRAKSLAAEKEISLAEIVRRGLDYVLSVSPPGRRREGGWSLDAPATTPLRMDPFRSDDWREEANAGASMKALLRSRPRRSRAR